MSLDHPREIGTRSGFTLLELMLALAVILAISSIVLPNLLDILTNRQLVRGGDGLRIALSEARLEAMRTGRTQIFRAQMSGRQFRVVPFVDAADTTEAADQMGRGTSVLFGAPAMMPPTSLPQVQDGATEKSPSGGLLAARMDEEMLPDGVLFEGVQVQATARSATIQQTSGLTPGDGWSTPILFYPDGTTSNAVLTITRQDYGRIHLKLRGLTGDTDISEVVP